MANTTRIAILAGLAILGSATGVGLGRSTIAQINPSNFETASSHFYGDMAPNRGSGRQPDLGGNDYLQADYAYSAAPACIGCDDYPVDYRPRRQKSPDHYDETWVKGEVAEVVTASAESSVVEPPPANREWIERYTTYQVAAEPAVQTAEVAPAQEES